MFQPTAACTCLRLLAPNPPNTLLPNPPPAGAVEFELLTNNVVIGLLPKTPITRPTNEASNVKVTASLANCAITVMFEAPIALYTPISRLLSLTIITIIKSMINDEAMAAPIEQIRDKLDTLLRGDIALVN